MRSAIAKYGRPKVFNFDNGKSYKNKQLELLAARIGTTLSYCQPYTPTGKAKIERWFRTMKDIRLRYSPDMKEIFIVESDGTLTPIRLLNKTENALIKREKVHLCKGDE